MVRAAKNQGPDRPSLADRFRQASDPSLADLLETFHFDPDKAEIFLNGQRMVLTDNAGLAIMRRELISALGYDRARGVMSRIGYSIGSGDAALALELRKDGTLFEGFTVGPQLHSLKGSVKVVPKVFEADRKTGYFYSEYEWHNSAECHAHLKEIGIGPHPGGWQQVGYASGYSSAFFGRPIIFRELSCVAMGHKHCFLVGKPAEDWDDPDGELRWFRAEGYPDRPASRRKPAAVAVGAPDRDDGPLGARPMVGASPGFNVTLHLVDKVARSEAPVLFLGESGVGKEVFARELHRRSRRADRDLVAVNCAAIPDTLIEAELFGVEKGAYTGADASRAGRFERADGGSLFLDEIGTLSLAAQGKLLRVLQEGEYERVGGTRSIRCDVRLIAATNAKMRADVEAGRFRADLFYRLNTFPIWIPPLRDRRADIPLLANFFLRKFTARHHKRDISFDDRVIRLFHDYHWPGNIREMENTIERGVILASDGEMIGVHHLMMSGDALQPEDGMSHDPLADFIIETAKRPQRPPIGAALLESGLSHDEVVDHMVRSALDQCGGNQVEAGRLIGMSRNQIAYRVKKLGLR
ncbi:transcriptional regulator, Fis family [Rhizorhabdus wittichii RW1]|uniref:Transcriptional regulator, Fis family n=1 Tax=Rhizorhabdus wittichii (strain DSM 6014 / CCUG 31198 / JCM 15750 / NBRC 105917 / EY 4224 / RW1) TaxID=392499 RepID=A0A9J9HDH4_RHIWR|nr:transcriptional regulator, Fis family [Rhizorhabdus wittichii RW1]